MNDPKNDQPDALREALKLVMQHGRIDDSEYRMNLVAAVLAKAEKSRMEIVELGRWG